ncbi:GGDEF domain-containing protein [Segnochrobactrum spirostomi]|uniref:diguanylate cyclase n=1 Tax=Segnochrobactrum spirostomi TaxID=2608987 RepID=A0A6A7Y866_9HYPH|nr:GGDEF domain-containing protein [Segnochrobactrum spirostomi]MQT14537.1 GGDEF domain-containing protein [Segnochrobactrum spirostomi]
MINLDIATVIFLHVTVLAAGAVAFAHLQRQVPWPVPLRWLGLAYAIVGVGALSAALGEHGALPPWLWQPLSLGCGTGGFAALWCGIRMLSRERGMPTAWLLLVPLGWLVFAHVIGFVAENWQRAGIFHLNAVVFLGATAWEVLRGRRREPLPSRLPLAIMLAVFALSFLAGIAMIASGTVRAARIAFEFYIQIFCYFGVVILVYGLVNERAQKRLRLSAEIDPLTGLGNRARLVSSVPPEVQGGDAAILLDIDHFKAVNDKFGHSAGDRVLAAVAETLRAKLRREDICVRYGGEEFAIILPDWQDVGAVAERLRGAIEAVKVPLGDSEIGVTVSLGVAISRTGNHSWTDLIDAADAALYEAKRAGRNRVVVQRLPAPVPARQRAGMLEDA